MTLLEKLAYWFGLTDDLAARHRLIDQRIAEFQANAGQGHPPRAGRVPPRRAQRREPVRWPTSDCSDV